jgi:hypothetical protein
LHASEGAASVGVLLQHKDMDSSSSKGLGAVEVQTVAGPMALMLWLNLVI